MPHEVKHIIVNLDTHLWTFRMVTSVAWGADPLDTVKPSLFSVGWDRVALGWKLRGKETEHKIV